MFTGDLKKGASGCLLRTRPVIELGASSASFGGVSGCAAMPRSKAQSLPVKEISSKLSKDELLRRLQVGMWYVSTGLSVTLM